MTAITRNIKPVLFVSHKSNRSGAPLLLLEIIKAYHRLEKIRCFVLCMEEGELVEDFKEVAETFVWRKRPATSNENWMAAIAGGLKRPVFVLRGLYILFKVRKSKLIFYNTIVNGQMQKKLSALSATSICYVHELQAAIHLLTNKEGLAFTLKNTQLFLCVSEAVQHNLIHQHQVSPEKVRVIPAPIQETNRSKSHYKPFIENFKERYQTGEAIIIGVIGNNEWRKGFSLFIPLVTIFFTLYPDSNVYFLWKGFSLDNNDGFFDYYDYEKCSHKERILLVAHGNDSIDYMSCVDIHLLLSREDPYPLVVLEAASFAIPTICFDQAGGATEFVEADAGFLVPYGNLYQMAIMLYRLVANQPLRGEMGTISLEKVKKRNHQENALKILTDILTQSSSEGY